MYKITRIDKLLSSLGYCSRSQAKQFLRENQVLCDGRLITSPADHVQHHLVSLNGSELDPPHGLVIMLNKPIGYTCSHKDEGPLVYDLLPERFCQRNPQLTSVGRLDKETSGLLLFSDNGKVIHSLSSPKKQIGKTYRASLARPLCGTENEIFLSGTLLLEGESKPLLPATLTVITATEVLLEIFEGRYHQVRRMFAAVGNHVEQLHRFRFGPLDLGDLPSGEFRILDQATLEALNLGGVLGSIC